MRVPVRWLGELVDLSGVSAERLAEALTGGGLEVDRIDAVGAPRPAGTGDEGLSRFVVGRVLSAEPHPNADRLRACVVDTGDRWGHERSIVCGAPNVAAGQAVVVALPGATLPGGLTLDERKLRGVVSAGMICSAAELGLGADDGGILVLDEDGAEPGRPADELLPLADRVLVCEVTANRPDLTGLVGVAREASALLGRPLRADPLDAPVPEGGGPAAADLVTVTVADPVGCPRYSARVVTGVTIAAAPPVVAGRLAAAGIRTISNVVDAGNYAMLLTGQPLHMFDLARVAGPAIVVRRAADGEAVTTLDGQRRVLSAADLVVADAERAQVIAGIMGAEDAEVSAATRDVLVEGANWERVAIQRTSTSLGLRSESSTRFEKGLDPELTRRGVDLAARLLAEWAGGSVAAGLIDVRTEPAPPARITLRAARLAHLLGYEVPVPAVDAALAALAFAPRRSGEGAATTWDVTVPSFRATDVTREVDLVEEVARVHGLEHAPATLPRGQDPLGGLTARQRDTRRVEDALRDRGLAEVITLGFHDPGGPARLGLGPEHPLARLVPIANPLSADLSVMRSTLLVGLLAAAALNQRRQQPRVALFEVGRTFHPLDSPIGAALAAHPPRDAPPSPAGLPTEEVRVAFVLAGALGDDGWQGPAAPADLWTAKGLVEVLLALAGMDPGPAFASVPDAPYLHPGRSARVRAAGDGDPLGDLGVVGELHPRSAEAFGLSGPVAVAELRLSGLVPFAAQPPYADVDVHPGAARDLAVVVDEGVEAAAVVATVRDAVGERLESVRVFDVYEGPQVGAGRRQIALRLRLRAAGRTLTDDEIGRAVDAAVGAVADRLGGELRR